MVAEGEERTGIRAENALGEGRERLKQSAKKEQRGGLKSGNRQRQSQEEDVGRREEI